MSSPYVTTGADGQGLRMELHEFVNDKYRFSLYIQALQRMEGMTRRPNIPESDPTSHYAIGGIHGLPYERWTGDSQSDPIVDNQNGYCTHGENLFPTWHRPYVSLYEQTIQMHAKEIAKQYNDPRMWGAFAEALRLPYWDWANPDTVIPPEPFITGDKVKIMTPSGPAMVDNPLLKYNFKNPLYDPWNRKTYTKTDRGSNSTLDGFKKTFNPRQARQIQQGVKDLFEKNPTWDGFSNHGPDNHYVANSLEGVHDNIHGLVGGFMGDPSRAGFDPLFYLHHCNVDRLLAMWQSLHPSVWVTRGPSRDGTNTIRQGTTVDSRTALAPFWKSKSAMFNSDAVRNFISLGYDYKDFKAQGVDRNDEEAVQKLIHTRVSELYGLFDENIRKYLPQDNPRVVEAIRSSLPADDVEHALDKLTMAFLGHVELTPAETEIFKPHPFEYFEWTARVRVKHYALKESFGVHFYLDPPSGNPSEGELYEAFVGSFHTFVNSNSNSCENCQSQDEGIDEGYVYLNQVIAERSGVNSFHPNNLLPWISSKLSWKVTKANGEEVPLDQIPSLEVVLHHIPIVLEPGKTRPAQGNVTRYPVLNGGF